MNTKRVVDGRPGEAGQRTALLTDGTATAASHKHLHRGACVHAALHRESIQCPYEEAIN